MTHPAAPVDPSAFVLEARAVLRERLDQVEAAIPRIKRASIHRDQARWHVDLAAAYSAGPHLGLAATSTAWALAHVDAAGGKAIGPALDGRWQEVRAALPESVRQAMPVRRRSCA